MNKVSGPFPLIKMNQKTNGFNFYFEKSILSVLSTLTLTLTHKSTACLGGIISISNTKFKSSGGNTSSISTAISILINVVEVRVSPSQVYMEERVALTWRHSPTGAQLGSPIAFSHLGSLFFGGAKLLGLFIHWTLHFEGSPKDGHLVSLE